MMETDIGISIEKVLITGGTSGLGLELVKLFLEKGCHVVATGRQELGLPQYEDKFKFFRVDFSDLNQLGGSVRKICGTFDFDLVINNAGVLSPPAFTQTIDGFEYTFQVNYLSHLLINEIILNNLQKKHPVKIITITSPVYRLSSKELTISSEEHDYNPLKAYTSSKLYLTLMSEFLPARYPESDIQSFSFNPGTFSSGIFRMQHLVFRRIYRVASPFMRSPVKVAKKLSEVIEKSNVKNGMICDLSKRLRPLPLIDENRKEAFVKTSYDIIGPYLLKNGIY